MGLLNHFRDEGDLYGYQADAEEKARKDAKLLGEAIQLLNKVEREGSYTFYDRVQKWLKKNKLK